eukprot:6311729-Pyramimonas_sp.AAC.1
MEEKVEEVEIRIANLENQVDLGTPRSEQCVSQEVLDQIKALQLQVSMLMTPRGNSTDNQEKDKR